MKGSFAEALAAVARAAQHTSYLIYRRRDAQDSVRFEERVEVELISVGAHYERDLDNTRPHRASGGSASM